MIKSLLKFILVVVFILVGIVAYQTDGNVNIRVDQWSVSMSFATFIFGALASLILLLYIASFLRYLGSLSTRLKTYWLKRHELEGHKYLEEALSDLEDGKLDQANKKARKTIQLLPDLLLPKWIMLRVMKSRGIALDSKLVSDLIRSKSMGLLGYRYLIEQHFQEIGELGAEPQITEALARYPSSKWLLEKLFESQIRDQNYLGAISTGQKLQSLYATGASRKIALCYYSLSQQSETNQRLKYLKLGHELDPSHPLISEKLATMYLQQNSPKKARTVVEQTWKYFQSKPLAQTYLKTAEGASSEVRINLALELFKISGESLLSHLIIIEEYLRFENYVKARYYLEKATQKNSGMSHELLLLRIALTEKDSAEKMDIPRWVREISSEAKYIGWKCSDCHTKHTEWEAICPKCNTLHKVMWTDEHKGVTSLSTIKEGA